MSATAHPAYRPDIDGLRAFAVLAVVGFHAFPGLFPGGFVGVDIFFVISGYLITGIILKGREQGDFSYLDFYARRIRRIFPTLLLVLAATLVAGYFLLLADEYKQLAGHQIAGTLFYANWAFWREAGYFDVSAELKPLLHLWSLGVEEQFYLLWPLLLALLLRRPRQLGGAILALLVLSFAANLAGLQQHPSATFFLPHSRFWELLAGAWLASRPPLPGVLRAGLAWLGLTLLLAGVFLLDRDVAFPGYAALLPVLGAAGLIAAGPGTAPNRLLGRQPWVFLGLISYPLYLWHWPLLSFPRILAGEETSWELRLIAVLLALLLAWLSYHYWERWLRFHPWRRLPLVLLGTSLLLALVALYVHQGNGLPKRGAFSQEAQQVLAPHASQTKGCKAHFGTPEGHCLALAPEAEKLVFLLGDSHARALAQGFPALAQDEASHTGWVSLGRAGCLPFAGLRRLDRGRNKECSSTVDRALALATGEPASQVVVISARYTIYHSGQGFGANEHYQVQLHFETPGQPPIDGNPEAFQAGLRATLTLLRQHGKQVIFMQQVPELGFLPRRCIGRPLSLGADPERCQVPRAQVEQRQADYRQAVARVLQDFPEVRVFDPLEHLCDQENCYARKDGQLLYRDDDHLNRRGAEFILGRLQASLAAPSAGSPR